MRRLSLVFLTTVSLAVLAPVVARGAHPPVDLERFRVSAEASETIQGDWTEQLLSRYPAGVWAPLEFRPTDEHLELLGLPSRRVLSRRYPEPTMVTKDGRFIPVSLPSPGVFEAARKDNERPPKGSGRPSSDDSNQPDGSLGPTVTSFAGAGWFGIRPGALLLLLTDGIGWCTMAHVYGSPGNYDISTAGHCGKTGDTATVVAAFGNRDSVLNPILLDFGKFAKSNDGGLGRDWALIDIDPKWQYLVTPTMAFWGGPRGMYTKTGSLVSVSFRGNGPKVSVTPDPLLAQTIVHYGHGLGTTGGVPRAAEAIHWGTTHFMFSGYVAPGDSGSGANTLLGDVIGANMEAAGIITHIWIDPLMRKGIGIMGGTRATQVKATLANGQIVSYPIPVQGLP